MLGGRSRRSLGSCATAVRITAILTAVGCCLAAAAYATVRYIPSGSVAGPGSHPLRPLITVHPDRMTTESTAQFDLTQPRRPPRWARPGFPLRYECRLDTGVWGPCTTPIDLGGIGHGIHRFAVRAVNRAGNASPIAAFIWRRIREPSPAAAAPAPEPPAAAGSRPTAPPVTSPPTRVPSVEPPQEEPVTPPAGFPFMIEQVGTVADLLPGAPAQTIEVQIENPNSVPISVTSLTASITNEPPGCPVAQNFALTAAAVSPAAPLVVPAESTLALSEAGVAGPTIAMVNLPIDQDACEAAELEIALTGGGAG